MKPIDTEAKTFFIVCKDKTVENVSRTRVTWAPDELTADEIHEDSRSMAVLQTITDYPVSKAWKRAKGRPPPPMEVLIFLQSSQNLANDAYRLKKYCDQPKIEQKLAYKI